MLGIHLSRPLIPGNVGIRHPNRLISCCSGLPPHESRSPASSPNGWTRRQLYALGLLASGLSSYPMAAVAADSKGGALIAGVAGEGLAGLMPPLTPQPVTVPRRRLGPSFAILLLRSGYEVADLLDFVAMDTFQKDFWLLRRSEWEPYTLQYSPIRIKQGDLSDPAYFDFISAMQLSTVSTDMRHGLQTFKEYCGDEEAGCSDGYRLVTRNPQLQDNDRLPAAFEAALGDAIYQGLREGFQGVQFGAPPPCPKGCSAEELLQGVKALLQIFVDQGYALRADVVDARLDGPFSFSARLEGPATLWSLQSVASRRGSLWPVYSAYVVAAYLRASGRTPSCSFSWNSTTLTEQWSVL